MLNVTKYFLFLLSEDALEIWLLIMGLVALTHVSLATLQD